MRDTGLVVFTDLDGTLLDHDNYSYVAALPALEKLRKHGIPLVIASSKTPAEIIPLRAELGFEDCPAIVENGAGILAANTKTLRPSETYERLISCLGELPSDMQTLFTGFSKMSADRIAAETGLSPEDAERAKLRNFSEPGYWHGDDAQRDRFLALLSAHGIVSKQGGRFLTLSFGSDKALRMTEILDQIQSDSGEKPFSIALGDAPNDIEMLKAADRGVIILNPAHSGITILREEDTGRISRSIKPGPDGWNESVLMLIANHIN